MFPTAEFNLIKSQTNPPTHPPTHSHPTRKDPWNCTWSVRIQEDSLKSLKLRWKFLSQTFCSDSGEPFNYFLASPDSTATFLFVLFIILLCNDVIQIHSNSSLRSHNWKTNSRMQISRFIFSLYKKIKKYIHAGEKAVPPTTSSINNYKSTMKSTWWWLQIRVCQYTRSVGRCQLLEPDWLSWNH